MIVYPNAKINLGLNIVGKRPDGFHNIETVFYPIPISDVLEIIPNKEDKVNFTSTGISIPSDGKPNLVEQAWQLVKNEYNILGVDVHLNKIVPIGAGLGGGSSDAAYMIKALNELFSLNIEETKLVNLASKLGADCAFFIKNEPLFAYEKGDQFSAIEIDLSGLYFVLVYPNIHVSTPEAYRHVSASPSEIDIEDILEQPIANWKGVLKNDFEFSVFKSYPQIEKVKEQLYEHGAIYASMSGSGSSVFGLFESEPSIDFGDFKAWSKQL